MSEDKKPKTHDEPNELSLEDIKRPDSATHHDNHKPSQVAAKPLDSHTTHTAPKLPWYKSHKRALIASIAILLAIGITGGVMFALRKPPEPVKIAESASPTPPPEPPKPVTKASLLTGVEMEPEKADQPVMSSIVENLVGKGNARPQSGLSTAGVVYEGLSEGGITRYLAVWQAETPTDIGPVRSLRPVFYDSAMEYSAPVVHAGGSTDGIAAINSGQGFKDIDLLSNSASYGRRVNTRYAPHNLYISGDKLRAAVSAKGWAKAPTFTAWQRKDDAPNPTPNASTITIDFSGADYRASFAYDAASNSYLRSIGGVPDVDAGAASKRINPKTVIAIYTTVANGRQPNGKPKTDIGVIGTGKGIIFQDGIATAITWQKTGSTARMKFLGADGKEVALNRGQSWVSYVPTSFPVSYK